MKESYKLLVEEGMKLKEKHDTEKYLLKIYMRSLVYIFIIFCTWIIFSKLNSIINIKDNNIISILCIALYLISCLGIILLTNMKVNKIIIKNFFIAHIILTSVSMSMLCDLSMLKGITLKTIITFIIYFFIFLICKYVKRYHFIPVLLLLGGIVILNIIGIIEFISIFTFSWLVICITLLLYNLNSKYLKMLERKKTRSINEYKNYIYCDEYLFFLNICLIFSLICRN